MIEFGQDECIFKQYIFRHKAWTQKKKIRPRPKDEGYGLMMSAFLSRVFGFGMEMTKDDMEKVNDMRQGKHFTDEDAENAINRGSVDYPKLKNPPFVTTLEYGKSAEGYWTYDRIILNLEDCIDCLKLLNPQYEFLFLFDSSCGHVCGQENGLNSKRMNVRFSGKQPKMHNILIKDNAG